MIKKDLSAVNFSVQKEVGNARRTCYLLKNNWDDYGFKTTFETYFVNNLGEQKYIGSVSIASKGLTEGRVEFPEDSFTQLPDTHFSLGQGQGYYEELMGLSSDDRIAILTGLRDCAYQQAIFNDFKNELSVKDSLLRHVTKENVTKLFPGIIKGNAVPTPYRFLFKLTDNNDTKIEVNVTPNSNPPSNIHILIGSNGVGKTRILSSIADYLTGTTSPNEISLPGEVVFPDNNEFETNIGENERFTNLVTIAFSAFDGFKPGSNRGENRIPCQYIGLKNEKGESFREPESLCSDFTKSAKICLNGQRKNRWINAIKTLNSDPIFEEYKLEQNSADMNELNKIFKTLSSGHKIILFTITKLVELVDEKTLVLIDEPECHLHPPLLSSFIRAISDLLISRNAAAIIATHSPVVLQEVPSSCVTKIERVGDEYSFYRPGIKTYGENIGTLTREVFKLELLESGFYKTIDDYLKTEGGYDSLISNFNDEIGAEGRAIARSIIATRGGGNA